MTGGINEFNAAVRGSDGLAVAKYLSILDPKIAQILQLSIPDPDSISSTNNALGLWYSVLATHKTVVTEILVHKQVKQAASAQIKKLTTLNRIAERADNWILPVLYTVSRELRQLATHADQDDDESALLEESTRSINRAFTICLNDRNPELNLSKKWGTYFFLGELLKIYLKLDKLPLAKNVVKVCNAMSRDLPPLDAFPKSHRTTYLFFWGVLLFIDCQYVDAQVKLSQALSLCNKNTTHNIEQILLYLIPAQLLGSSQSVNSVGGTSPKAGSAACVLPSSRLYDRFPRLKDIYKTLLDSAMAGDFTKFYSTQDAMRSLLIRRYLYLAVEKISEICAHSLIIKTWKYAGQKGNRLSIRDLTTAFGVAGYFDTIEKAMGKLKDDDKYDQVECVAATMITTGKMKGYISHEHRIIVLSSKNPFPGRVSPKT